jgi:hypothetical protein
METYFSTTANAPGVQQHPADGISGEQCFHNVTASFDARARKIFCFLARS